jgi:NADH-quinone oxidoreductase subunit A
MLGLSIVVAGTLVGVSQLLGQYIPTREKLMPYECGKDPVGSAHERFSVKFYMIALLFILFDIEAIFFVPWAVIFRQLAADLTAGKIYNLAANDLSKMFVFWEMLVFIAILLVGYIYVWKKGILDWRK